MAFLRKATFQTVDRWQVSPLCFYLEYKLKASYVYKHHFIEDLIHYNAPPHAKSWLTGKDPDAGRDWGQEEKGTTKDEMAGWHHRLDAEEWVNSGSWWWTGRPGVLRFMELQRVGHDWATELKDQGCPEVEGASLWNTEGKGYSSGESWLNLTRVLANGNVLHLYLNFFLLPPHIGSQLFFKVQPH